MSSLLILIPIVLQIAALSFIKQGNQLSEKPASLLFGIFLWVISSVFLCTKYGVLGGMIISIAMLSLLGMLLPLLQGGRNSQKL